MEDKSSLEKLKEPFKVTVIEDSPDSNFCYRFLVFLFARSPLPTPILKEKRVIALILLEFQLLGVGGLKVARFTNIMLKIPALFRGVVSFSTSCRPG